MPQSHRTRDKVPVVKIQAPDRVPLRLSVGARLVRFGAIVLPFLGLVVSVVVLWGWGLSWVELMLCGGMYLLTGLGITVGYHRLFTHRSFETNRVVECVLAVLGSMAVQGPLLSWVALHRKHHQHSDEHEDPHSPHHQGPGFLGLVRGFWFAHVGWMLVARPVDLSHYVKDLGRSKVLRTVSALFPVWAAAGLLIPALLGWLLLGGWTGPLLGLVWGGLVRVFFVHHVTWSVNSVCHLWGQRPYPERDESRNNFLVGVLSLGEGWHNNHHAFPSSARHGLRWWQIDVSYWFICGLALLGLARNVKLPRTLPPGAE
jgi:stearoyl-CoA desaturase (delta-9 desaturase)